jgi:hypothetical protein
MEERPEEAKRGLLEFIAAAMEKKREDEGVIFDCVITESVFQ